MKTECTNEWLEEGLIKGSRRNSLQKNGLAQNSQDENPIEANPYPHIIKDLENNEGLMENDSRFRDEIYSKAVRAGKRTYFFDVKSTRRDEFYLTITESKKLFETDGNFYFEKHKIFLYKEDFEKYVDGLLEVLS